MISPQKTTPAITWTNPDDITVGTALSSTQLNAIARDPVSGNDVAGTWLYTPDIGTQLAEGQQQTLMLLLHQQILKPTTQHQQMSKSMSMQ